jgi:hypothetical protein
MIVDRRELELDGFLRSPRTALTLPVQTNSLSGTSMPRYGRESLRMRPACPSSSRTSSPKAAYLKRPWTITVPSALDCGCSRDAAD